MGVPVGLNDDPLDRTAALVLIDRRFDPAGPLFHADTLIDSILTAIQAQAPFHTKSKHRQ